MKDTIKNRLKHDIVAILTEWSYGTDDGYGGTNTGVSDDDFHEVSEDIVKMIVGSYEINGIGRLLGEKIVKKNLM